MAYVILNDPGEIGTAIANGQVGDMVETVVANGHRMFPEWIVRVVRLRQRVVGRTEFDQSRNVGPQQQEVDRVAHIELEVIEIISAEISDSGKSGDDRRPVRPGEMAEIHREFVGTRSTRVAFHELDAPAAYAGRQHAWRSTRAAS